MFKITKSILKDVYKERPPGSKKYDYGLLLVIGGGESYTGSPALSALAAFRSGVDMVRILAPERAANIIASFSPNLAAYPLKGKWLDKEDVPTLVAMSEAARGVAGEKTAVVIGGGLGRSERTKEAVVDYLRQINLKGVVDADGIYALHEAKDIIKEKELLITPHSYEFFVLTGKKVRGLPLEERAQIVKEEAAKLGCVILLKGREDVISDGQEVFINPFGSPYLTVGGTGDTLAGICGGLIAQGIPLFLAAKAGAFINARAGEIAIEKFGPGITATDLIEAIPEVIKQNF